jgi:hypothetical protein
MVGTTGHRSIIGRIKASGQQDDPLYVIVEGISITTFFKEGSLTGAAASPTVNTIVTQAFVASTFEKIVLIQASATNYSKYFLKVNGTTISTKRSGPDYNIEFDFTGAPYALIIGDTVTVEAEHASGTVDYEATIFGYA